MIGDQLDRDIVPAKEAGLTTIYFPGGFQPKWQSTEYEDFVDYWISAFDEAVTIIKNIAEKKAERGQSLYRTV